MFTKPPIIFPDSLVVGAYWLDMLGLMAGIHLAVIDEDDDE